MNTDNNDWLDTLNRLTRAGHEWVQTDSGKKLAERQGLLPQLRTAVFAGMENTGGASSFGSKPPLDASAVDLLEEITDQATAVLAAVSHRATPVGFAEDYVRSWASQTDQSAKFIVEAWLPTRNFVYDSKRPHDKATYRAEESFTALELLKRWTTRCEDFFNPPSTREIAAECPACTYRYAHREKDGQIIRTAALNIHRDKNGTAIEAKCAVCSTSWPPSQFGFLASLVGAKDSELIVEEKAKEKPLILSEQCLDGSHGYSCKSMRCQCDCHLEVGNFRPQHADKTQS